MEVRAEKPDDWATVHALHRACFSGPDEADLVDALRDDGDAVISLVAVEGDTLVGHALFSRMKAPFRALGLAPVSVLPDRRRQGIAAHLIETGIAEARADGWDGVFVLGDPAYYQRFGFRADAAAGFASPYAGPYLMALSLQKEDLPVSSGDVAYAPAFSRLE